MHRLFASIYDKSQVTLLRFAAIGTRQMLVVEVVIAKTAEVVIA
jgi:hypothetical protein